MNQAHFMEWADVRISGPEHNAYYDIDRIFKVCAEIMTPEQRTQVTERLADMEVVVRETAPVPVTRKKRRR